MEEFFNSNVYNCVGFIANIITYLGFFVAILLIKHNKKLKHYPISIDGGNPDNKKEIEKSVNYSNTKLYKIIECLIKIF